MAERHDTDVLFKAPADPSRRKLLDLLHGEIAEAEPPRRLVSRWQHQNKPELKAEDESQCTMGLKPIGTAVKLSITHTIEREPSKFIAVVSGGWPKIISNLKSLLRPGCTVLRGPYPS